MRTRPAAALATVGLCLLAAAAAPAASLAAAPPTLRPNPIEIVLDTSGSMDESDGSGSGRIKIDGAKVALLDFLQQVESQTPIGLRNYPGSGSSQGPEGCSAGDVRFAVQPRDPTAMAATIRTLDADGDTPTSAALEAAADELRATGASEGTIVLVSDGESNCGPDPCDTAAEIAASGIALQTITVGFRVSGAGAKELQCIADQTGGQYISADDNAALADAFDEISRPKIQLTVSYPSKPVTAQVGNDPSGLVRIEGTVENISEQLARGVVARLRFDAAAGSPAVTRPLVHLGNLDRGESRKVSWSFRPGVPPDDRSPMLLPFTVLAGAQNTQQDAEFKATIEVTDAYDGVDDAGPILSSRRNIAILGDSFSAGEGAEAYLARTDTNANRCHRSLRTYLAPVFDLPASNLIACSGAEIVDVTAPQAGSTVDAQTAQLQALEARSGFDAVVLTLGGNDIGFSTIAKSCLVGRSDCSRTVYEDVPLWQQHPKPAAEYTTPRLEALPRRLISAYEAIDSAANGPGAHPGRGPVPLLVLAYPMPTPLTPRSCLQMLNQLSGEEIDFLDQLVIELNGKIEGAVERARRRGVPVFFVPNTEMAFQPDHSLCDRQPYARTLKSFNGAGFDGGSLLASVKRAVVPSLSLSSLNPVTRLKRFFGIGKSEWGQVERSFQELVHPNAAGYAAETRAILRWSQSPDAISAERLLSRMPVADPLQVTVVADGPDLGQLAPGEVPTLQGGTSYPLSLQGFAPGSTVTIEVHSAPQTVARLNPAPDGSLSLRVPIPPGLEGGDHTLTITGTGADGSPSRTAIEFRVEGEGTPAPVESAALGGALAALGAILLGLASAALRRRAERPGPGDMA